MVQCGHNQAIVIFRSYDIELLLFAGPTDIAIFADNNAHCGKNIILGSTEFPAKGLRFRVDWMTSFIVMLDVSVRM